VIDVDDDERLHHEKLSQLPLKVNKEELLIKTIFFLYIYNNNYF